MARGFEDPGYKPGQLLNQTILTLTNQANQTFNYVAPLGTAQAIAGMTLTYTPPVNSKLLIVSNALMVPSVSMPEVYFDLKQNGVSVGGDLEHDVAISRWRQYTAIAGGDLTAGTAYTWAFYIVINTNPCQVIVNGNLAWSKAIIEIKADP